jgi:hypothetical protein
MSLWREYAAEPAVFCRTWADCNHVLDDIGWHKGRLIAEFPHREWRRLFYDCLQESKETQARKSRIVERFKQFVGTTRQERLRNGLIPTSRVYVQRNTWLERALEAHTLKPFDSVVAVRFLTQNCVPRSLTALICAWALCSWLLFRARESVNELRKQTQQLQRFNTDLSIAISEGLDRSVPALLSPLCDALTLLSEKCAGSRPQSVQSKIRFS